jgi:hypothetical protein
LVNYESDKARYWRACDVWTFSEVLFLLNGEWPNEDESPPSSLTTTVISFPKEIIHDLGDDGFIVEHDTEVQVFNPIPDDVLLHQIVEDAVAAGRLSPLVHKSPRYKRDFEDRFLPSEVIAWATSRGCFPDFPFAETDADIGSSAHPTQAVAFVVADSTSNAPAPTPVEPELSTQEAPDPERRLSRLRELGGSAKHRSGEWRFTGIASLVASEKAQGRSRIDEKTIRADLKEALQNELEAKRAGFGSGLGQR